MAQNKKTGQQRTRNEDRDYPATWTEENFYPSHGIQHRDKPSQDMYRASQNKVRAFYCQRHKKTRDNFRVLGFFDPRGMGRKSKQASFLFLKL